MTWISAHGHDIGCHGWPCRDWTDLMATQLPLVYSCSGCSSAAQMANQLALWLDRDGAAEMSCIAGVGGGVRGLVRTAQSGRPILALDGCVLACVAACLRLAGRQPDRHVLLSDFGVKKARHADFDVEAARELFDEIVCPAALALHVVSYEPIEPVGGDAA